jgi:hypothetical protein
MLSEIIALPPGKIFLPTLYKNELQLFGTIDVKK